MTRRVETEVTGPPQLPSDLRPTRGKGLYGVFSHPELGIVSQSLPRKITPRGGVMRSTLHGVLPRLSSHGPREGRTTITPLLLLFVSNVNDTYNRTLSPRNVNNGVKQKELSGYFHHYSKRSKICTPLLLSLYNSLEVPLYRLFIS